ncbi:hypothetical protein PHOSAC3_120053 [Mesotoga infera]|nr:hypothetical protein PHOSAC3_120053 [Mesotoga infera]
MMLGRTSQEVRPGGTSGEVMPTSSGSDARFAGEEPLGQQTLKAVRWGKRFFDTSLLASFFLLNEPERKERGR